MAQFDKAKKTRKRHNYFRIKIGDYSVFILALPIFPIFLLSEKIKKWNYDHLEWNEVRATKVLDKTLPKILEWNEEDNAFYYSMDWGYDFAWRTAPLLHRKWARKFGCKLKKFIKEGYENTEYTKTIEEDYYNTWIKFVEKR